MKLWTVVISAGTGPVEVRQFVALLSRHLEDMCVSRGLEICSVTVCGDERAPRSVELEVRGPAQAALAGVLGTHQLTARSRRRGRRSRKRWFAGVSLHPAPPPPKAVSIDPAELEIRAARAGGPGGQHVNTTSSAVRVRHKPSGTCIRVASERSQHRNRSAALARLAAILSARQRQNRHQRDSDIRSSHHRLERGSPVQEWILDHRSGALRPV